MILERSGVGGGGVSVVYPQKIWICQNYG